MKYLRYSGEFLSRENVKWRVDILQESVNPFTVGELVFDAHEALTIGWAHKDKEEPICGSSATLRIISPGDRTYQDLYTIEPGNIQMQVYRENTLYWSGMLDPEFYEEPYEALDGYTVDLLFSDFGILSRKKYNIAGVQSLSDIVAYCLAAAGLNPLSINKDHISTSIHEVVTGHMGFQWDETTNIRDGRLSVRSDNFIDEAGEPFTLYEVLEGILQPLALKMIQRAGTVYLYDLNGLYNGGEEREIVWAGSRQTMSTDKVANNVIVTFSPYSSGSLMDADSLTYEYQYDIEHINTSTTAQGGSMYGDYYSFYPDYNPSHKMDGVWDYNLVDFTIFLADGGSGLRRIGDYSKYFHILPLTGSVTETSGVAYFFQVGHRTNDNDTNNYVVSKLHGGIPRLSDSAEMVFRTNGMLLPKIDQAEMSRFYIRITEEMLMDYHYNPFSGSNDYNDIDEEGIEERSRFVFIPVRVTVYGADGTALCHYKNSHIAESLNTVKGHLNYAIGEWVDGVDEGGDCLFEYYNPKDDSKPGIGKWSRNRQCVGCFTDSKLYDSFAGMPDGEYLPYPPYSGWLEVEVWEGADGKKVDIYDWSNQARREERRIETGWDGVKTTTVTIWPSGVPTTESFTPAGAIRQQFRWALYKAPKVEVVNRNLVFDLAELEDVEYSGHINDYAKDSIAISTICGSSDKVCPTARGVFFKTETGEQIRELRRAGRTDHPEKLLIGTLYSQFANRKTVLSGEAEINGGLYRYTEASQPQRHFMLLGEVQNVIQDCTESEYCEFRPDEYDGIQI